MAMMERANTRDYSQWWQKPGTFPFISQLAKPPIEGRPHSIRENYIRTVKGKKPWWMPLAGTESNTIWPDAMEECPVPEVPGYDWWGVQWANSSEIVTGMMVAPGTRAIQDFGNWRKEFTFPDVSQVDFATDGKKIQGNLDPDRPHIYECVKGCFERLNEVIPMDEALLSFYTDPEALADFFHCMADYKIETTSKIFANYGQVDGICYHDDWGTQRAPFFSNDMFREQLFPETKRYFDYVQGEGKFIELHSCGLNTPLVPLMIEMGVDLWGPQTPINDPEFLYDHYGKDMSFSFPITGLDAPDMTEEEVRQVVRNFVDRFGGTGRVMASFRLAPNYRDRMEWAKDELYTYSTKVYQKQFHE